MPLASELLTANIAAHFFINPYYVDSDHSIRMSSLHHSRIGHDGAEDISTIESKWATLPRNVTSVERLDWYEAHHVLTALGFAVCGIAYNNW